MGLRTSVLALALSSAACDDLPPGATATGDEKDEDPHEVAAVDVPGQRDDRDRMDRDRLRRGDKGHDVNSAGPHLNFHGPSVHEGTAATPTTARPGVAQAPGASGVRPQPSAIDQAPGTMIHGNLGDIVAVEGQPATVTATIDEAAWSGSLIGRAIVIHEKGNDPNAGPDGGAGGRIACGVIGIAKGEDGDAAAAGDPTPGTPPPGGAPVAPNPY
jgi:Cu/Zn superoxide dismutase